MRKRDISPKYFSNGVLGRYDPPTAGKLFIGLWCEADRKGRLVEDVDRLQAFIFPYHPDAPMEQFLAFLHANEFIERYEVEGRRLIWIKEFEKHQHIHHNEQPSKLPAPGMPRTCRDIPALSHTSTVIPLQSTVHSHARPEPRAERGHAPDMPRSSPVQAPDMPEANPGQDPDTRALDLLSIARQTPGLNQAAFEQFVAHRANGSKHGAIPAAKLSTLAQFLSARSPEEQRECVQQSVLGDWRVPRWSDRPRSGGPQSTGALLAAGAQPLYLWSSAETEADRKRRAALHDSDCPCSYWLDADEGDRCTCGHWQPRPKRPGEVSDDRPNQP